MREMFLTKEGTLTESIKRVYLSKDGKYYHANNSIVAAYENFNIKDIDSSIVADRLWMEYSIAVRSGIHCAPLIHQALGTDKQGTVRFSFSRFNTQEEVKQALIAIKEIRDDLCQD